MQAMACSGPVLAFLALGLVACGSSELSSPGPSLDGGVLGGDGGSPLADGISQVEDGGTDTLLRLVVQPPNPRIDRGTAIQLTATGFYLSGAMRTVPPPR
jgi:hypothetical protein